MRSASLVAGISSAMVLALVPATASAALSSVGPVDPDTGFPAYYVDSNGVALEPCTQGPPRCVASPGALSVVGGEANYWRASPPVLDSPILAGRKIRLDLALIASRTAAGPTTFSRIRFRADSGALQPGGVYTVTEPFGTDTYTADATGGISTTAGTQDGDALNGRIGPFLTWDPAVAPAAPAGFVGDGATLHTVTGSPTGNNSFKVTGPGLPQAGIGSDQFVVEGKRATRFPKITVSPASLDFGRTTKLGTTSSKTVTVTSAGPLALTVTGASITNSLFGEYSITGDTCSPKPIVLAPNATCAITVTFAPAFILGDPAQLTITSNALGQPSTVVPISGAGSLL
jgi:hypothetical protein